MLEKSIARSLESDDPAPGGSGYLVLAIIKLENSNTYHLKTGALFFPMIYKISAKKVLSYCLSTARNDC